VLAKRSDDRTSIDRRSAFSKGQEDVWNTKEVVINVFNTTLPLSLNETDGLSQLPYCSSDKPIVISLKRFLLDTHSQPFDEVILCGLSGIFKSMFRILM
jgi:hypothetical protein